MKILVMALIVFSVSCSASSQHEDEVITDTDDTDADAGSTDEDQDSICEALEGIVSKHIDTSGVSNKAIGMIVRVESPAISRTCSYGSLVKGEEVTPDGDEQWVIGSVSKMITSHMIARSAVDTDGLLDAPARDYLPSEWTVPAGAEGEQLTLAHLMTHTSGLPHYPQTLQDSIDSVTGLEDMYDAWESYTIEDLEDDLGQTTLGFEPGTEYFYSDFGFALVQRVAENLHQEAFPQVLEDFSSLMGLSGTVAPESLSEDQKSHLFYGHGGSQLVAMEEPVVTPVFTGDGFIYSDAEDLGRLLRVFAGIDEAPDQTVSEALALVKEERFQREAGQVSVAQGLGIGIIAEGDFTLYKKNGTSAGTTTAFLWDDENHLGVVVAGNVIPFSEGVNDSICEVYRFLAEDLGIAVADEVTVSCQVAF